MICFYFFKKKFPCYILTYSWHVRGSTGESAKLRHFWASIHKMRRVGSYRSRMNENLKVWNLKLDLAEIILSTFQNGGYHHFSTTISFLHLLKLGDGCKRSSSVVPPYHSAHVYRRSDLRWLDFAQFFPTQSGLYLSIRINTGAPRKPFTWTRSCKH